MSSKGINAVRILATDAVQEANSGHPGTPMGLAPVGYVLRAESMNYNPRNPDWANRDHIFLKAKFSNAERHNRRLAKVAAIENRNK